jgi:hypothetical protein
MSTRHNTPVGDSQIIDFAAKRGERDAARMAAMAAQCRDPDCDTMTVMFRGTEIALSEPEVQKLLHIAFAAAAIPGRITLTDLQEVITELTGIPLH